MRCQKSVSSGGEGGLQFQGFSREWVRELEAGRMEEIAAQFEALGLHFCAGRPWRDAWSAA